jgi:hypothetical protein
MIIIFVLYNAYLLPFYIVKLRRRLAGAVSLIVAYIQTNPFEALFLTGTLP